MSNGPSITRKAHGNGAKALLRAETPALDELRPLNAADAERGNAVVNARGKPFERGNKAGANRKPGLALLGSPVDSADPRYRRALRKAKSYMRRRATELAVQHGGTLGAGPSAMLANSALALAASRVLYELASETLDPDLLSKAAALADKSRQQELTAVALAEREGVTNRGKRNPIDDVRARILGTAAEVSK